MWEERIAQDDDIVFGKIRIKDSRIYLSIIMNLLANGETNLEIIDAYPYLTNDDIEAAIWVAHNLIRYHEIRKDLKLEEIINLNQIEEMFDFTQQLDPKYKKWIRFLVTKCGFKYTNSSDVNIKSFSNKLRLYSNIIDGMGHFIPTDIDFTQMEITDTGRVIDEQFLHGKDELNADITQYIEYYGLKIEEEKIVMDISLVKNEYALISKINGFVAICKFLINCFIDGRPVPTITET